MIVSWLSILNKVLKRRTISGNTGPGNIGEPEITIGIVSGIVTFNCCVGTFFGWLILYPLEGKGFQYHKFVGLLGANIVCFGLCWFCPIPKRVNDRAEFWETCQLQLPCTAPLVNSVANAGLEVGTALIKSQSCTMHLFAIDDFLFPQVWDSRGYMQTRLNFINQQVLERFMEGSWSLVGLSLGA